MAYGSEFNSGLTAANAQKSTKEGLDSNRYYGSRFPMYLPY